MIRIYGMNEDLQYIIVGEGGPGSGNFGHGGREGIIGGSAPAGASNAFHANGSKSSKNKKIQKLSAGIKSSSISAGKGLKPSKTTKVAPKHSGGIKSGGGSASRSKVHSSDYSKVDKNHKRKGSMNLSDLDVSIRGRKDEGMSNLYTWRKNGKFVGRVLVDTIPASDGYKWFGSLRVSEKYRGYGLGDQIVEFVKDHGGGALAVSKDNEIAKRLYKKHGFKTNSKRKNDEYYFMYYSENKTKGR